jgi:hypothetical protein
MFFSDINFKSPFKINFGLKYYGQKILEIFGVERYSSFEDGISTFA